MANVRSLTSAEQAILDAIGSRELALWFVTATQIKKKIIDATQPIREFLASSGLHDYEQQEFGPEAKVFLGGLFLFKDVANATSVSLYRAATRGDERFLPSELEGQAEGGDVFALFALGDKLAFLNLSRSENLRAAQIIAQVGQETEAGRESDSKSDEQDSNSGSGGGNDTKGSGRNLGGGQGFSSDPELTRCIERRGMVVAESVLRRRGFEFRDVHATHSCEYIASKNGEEVVVEVKGTTGGFGSIIMTQNEVELHQRSYPLNMLIVVYGIEIERIDGNPSARGGVARVMFPWSIDDARLRPINLTYRLLSDEGEDVS